MSVESARERDSSMLTVDEQGRARESTMVSSTDAGSSVVEILETTEHSF